MTTEWLDYPVDLTRSVNADKGEGVLRHAFAYLFVTAARQGWDVEHDNLYAARRTERWDTTVRIARDVPAEIVDKWALRGWTIMHIDDEMRAQLLRLLLPRATV